MSASEPVAALEIGSSRTVLAVGEPLEGGRVRLISKGEAASRGVRKSQITNIELAGACVRAALQAVEGESGYSIGRAFLAVSGSHIKSEEYTTTRKIENTITREDLEHIYHASLTRDIEPDEFTLLDDSDLGYSIDGMYGVLRPVGMSGRLLRMHSLAVYGSTPRISDAKAAAAMANLEIVDSFFAGICAATGVLSRKQRENGTLVIDLGGGTTSWTVHRHDRLTATGVIGVGGDHVTNDIHEAFSLSALQAEKLKVHEASAQFGDAPPQSEMRIECPSDTPGFDPVFISRHALDTVVNARMRETFSIVLAELDDAGLLHELDGGIVLTGGGALLRGARALAQDVFGRDVSLGRIVPEVEGFGDTPDQARYASIAGLLLTGCRSTDEYPARSSGFNPFKSLFGRFAK